MNLESLEFHNPWILLAAIPALAIVYWGHRKRRPRPALVFPSVAMFRGLRPSWRQRLLFLIPLSHALAVILLVVALARPREGDVRTEVTNEGIAIQMVLDRSASMEEKMRFGNRERKRIEIVKRVFQDFVSGDEDGLGGRKGDLIGLTAFARFAEESCPLIAQHEPLITAVKNLHTIPPAIDRYGQQISADKIPRDARQQGYQANPLNRTAIGDGIRNAVLSLVAADGSFASDKNEAGHIIKGKVIIVLTDGQDNASEMLPVDAGRLAKENDIRLYYILMDELNEYRTNPFTGRKVVSRRRSRDELLAAPREVAQSADRAFLATDGDALKEIYTKIDELERTKIGKIEYHSYDEKFLLFLIPGCALAFLGLLLGESLLRRVP